MIRTWIKRFVYMTVLWLIAITFVFFAGSCTPKSAMMTKAVILDSKPRTTDAQMWYYVNLPTYGIKDRIVTYGMYEIGDTVLVHDKWRNYDVK